jgi:hypothetical protein
LHILISSDTQFVQFQFPSWKKDTLQLASQSSVDLWIDCPGPEAAKL